MQVYLQYKYYITVPKTGEHHIVAMDTFPWGSVERRYENGNTTTYNNQDRYVNEFVPPKTWTLPGSVWCIT